MKIPLLCIIILLLSIRANAQELASLGDDPIVEVKTNNQAQNKNYYVVTPLLLRESAVQSYEEEYAIRNGSKFHAFFSSLVMPGSGQIKNNSWWKAGLFLGVEVASVYLFVDNRNKARNGERDFEKWANRNWSVVEYSNWLVRYHEVNDLDNPHIDELREMVEGEEATFNIQTDWEKIDLNVLRAVERNTLYITSDAQINSNFSHTLPDYGSQQYYELLSKYYQYQAGWKDYNDFHDTIGHTDIFYDDRYQIDRGGAYASPFFYQGAQIGDQFNTDFRRGGYFVSILIANHIISAFDAYFTLKVKQNRLLATSSVVPGKQFTLTYRF
ncbi:DUF5683 domain-containing protein [Rhodohalobacter sp. 614A]|uniref:DUF5683 domain-containing protein n=1 Tax=Rhodohalobacter sp. 614A TaxID=2908649 RepID=UPI001F271088|nr:DUF5683 domain-containing protein [Rhodohalobacter sp. 614A]